MKKGITLITLIIMIVVMLILTTTVTITGAQTINNSKKMKFASELLFMQETINNYKDNNGGNLPITGAEITSSSLPQDVYYEVDMSLLGLIDTTYGRKLNGDTEDIYVVSNTDNIVYYLKGLKIGSTIYYNLNDELKKIINYTDSTIEIKDGIIFTQSENNYTNNPINVKVQVPIEYSEVSVFSESSQISDYVVEDQYNVYDITKSSNYDIIVNYTKNDKTYKQTYLVSNFDIEAPTIEITNITTLIGEDSIKVNVVISTNDNLSGINKILYEVGNVEKSYFETDKKGKIVTNNNVTVDDSAKGITFYIIDNAGNSEILFQEINIATSENYANYGLIAYYDAINNTGGGHSNTITIWKDLSGNNNNGVLNRFNGTNSSGWKDTELNADGLDDYVDIGFQDYDFNNITIDMIVKVNNNVGDHYILGNWENAGGGLVYYKSSSTIAGQFFFEDISNWEKVYLNQSIEIGTYYSIVLVYDGKNLSIYINGELSAQTAVEDKIKTSSVPIYIGGNPTTSGPSSCASISVKKTMIYNRALNDQEIKENYNTDKVRFGI